MRAAKSARQRLGLRQSSGAFGRTRFVFSAFIASLRFDVLAAVRVFLFTSLACSALAAAGDQSTSVPVHVQLHPDHPGPQIPSDFSGLSFEVALLLPGANGLHYFRPDNQPLLRLLHQLGIHSLRIGGNTSDRNAKQLPTEADLDSLFAFAKAAQVKVIYCLRLHQGDPAAAASTAKYLLDRYAAQIECFSIGQEPSAYPTEKVDTRPSLERMGTAAEKYSYASYRAEWKRFADTIIAAVPDVRFCGPGVHNNATWARQFIADFGRSNHVNLCVMHLYAGGAGNKVPTPEIGRERMLSGEFFKTYQKLYDGFVPMSLSNALPYRLEEVNNYFNGGALDVSDTFASALWGLEFMHWWAAHQAAGLNFHTGDGVAAGSTLQPSKYTAYFSTPTGYQVRPLGYALKAFALGATGRIVPVEVGADPKVNLDAYGVLGENQGLFVTLINKEHGPSARDASVTLAGSAHFSKGQLMLLKAPNGDVAAKSGVTLGGAGIKEDATWDGAWQRLEPPGKAGDWVVHLPAASAAIVNLTAN